MKEKVRPVKPHFFKPIQPGFKQALKIPTGFLKYLKGYDHIEHAILRSGSKQWRVKVSGCRFEAGWADFAQQHDLQLGDLLIFRHEGNMEFEVTIFDSSGIVREYAEYLQEEKEGEAAHTFGETSEDFEFEEKPSPGIKSSNKVSSHAEAATHFECTIRPYCLSRSFLILPQQFANSLTNKKCYLILRDERQRTWNLKLSSNCQKRVYIGGGWRKFIADNRLKEGDRIMFELVTDGGTSIWKFQVVSDAETPMEKSQDIRKKPSNMSPLNAKVSTSTSGDDNDLPYFISTIKPYCTKKSVLYFPLDFAKSNGLMNRKCEMILKDEEQRSWTVWLGRDSHHFGIINGWSKFRTANGLQVGDTFKFELIKNEEIPIAHLHCKYSEKVAKREGQ
ncbi:PREDICTED: B3 domain-containing protein REM10-like [Nicotiana attenuata]|uniref:B3 domain-containing protein rem10 n=1 Tax=Nicotiana attenuata TaxID=49451 RepID=A0A1J6IX34_NICAT|nr:PREDICTED: B3 domain-containing protein REM10-like [Nicotiana attenuata]OIT02263.1 b3 domain-containing protein rem10 [Nicotiana attenuata]